MGFFDGGVMDVIHCDETEYLIWKWHPKEVSEADSKRANAIRWASSLRVGMGWVDAFVITNIAHRKLLIDVFLNTVYLYNDKVVITFNYKEDTETVNFSDIEAALQARADGSGSKFDSSPKTTTSPPGGGSLLIYLRAIISRQPEAKRTERNGAPAKCLAGGCPAGEWASNSN